MEKLKDIKSSEIINIDFSIYIYSLLGFVVLIVLFFTLRYFLNKKKKKPTAIQISKKYLKNMNFDRSTKELAYDFTLHAKVCLDEKFSDEYDTLVNKLESYKYKKDVSQIPQELIDDMKDFIRVRV